MGKKDLFFLVVSELLLQKSLYEIAVFFIQCFAMTWKVREREQDALMKSPGACRPASSQHL